jgi:hypothetical protein
MPTTCSPRSQVDLRKVQNARVGGQLEREAVLAYAEKMARELIEVAEHLGQAVAAFQATVEEFQNWLEAGHAVKASPEPEAVWNREPAVALVPEQAVEVDQRSGSDRRGGEERRVFVADGLVGRIIRSVERREGDERRSGAERRGSAESDARRARAGPTNGNST